jgi:hypothetical protein
MTLRKSNGRKMQTCFTMLVGTITESLWCPRPESNRHARYQRSGGF